MWLTLSLLIILLAFLIFSIYGLVIGKTFWLTQLFMVLWLAYFVVVTLVFLYREQVHNAKAGSVFKLHDELLVERDDKKGRSASSTAKNSVHTSGSTLADEDKLL